MALLNRASDGLSGGTTSPTLNKFLGAPKPYSGPVPSSGTPWAPAPVAPAPSPVSYTSSPSRAIAPVSNYVPQQSYAAPGYGAATQNSVGGSISGGGGGNYQAAASAPSRPPMTYDQFSDDMAATDSVFVNQKSQYADALKKFIADNDRQKGILKNDADVAQKGIERNRVNGLTGLSEDFASRGLANSGLFTQDLKNASDQYAKQNEQVLTQKTNGINDLDFRRAKYEQENGENGSNIQAARREAFARLAASQGLT